MANNTDQEVKDMRNICISCVIEGCKISGATSNEAIIKEAIEHWIQGYDSFVELFGKFESLSEGYTKMKWFLIGAGLIKA